MARSIWKAHSIPPADGVLAEQLVTAHTMIRCGKHKATPTCQQSRNHQLFFIRSDGRRPNGLTQIPKRYGKCMTWDVTNTDTLAKSYLLAT